MNTAARTALASPFRAGALLFLAAGSPALWGQAKDLIPLASADGRRVLIPVKDLGTEARFFSYKAKNNAVLRFFAMLDARQDVHVAFDACDVCYQARKGYRIVNQFAVCNNCGRRFPIAAIGTDNLTGGCWPSYLPVSVSGGRAEIKTADLENKSYLFP